MKEKKKNLLSRIFEEYGKVSWAKKSDVFHVTVIVLLITLFVATLIILFDISFKVILNQFSELLRKVLK